jgi:hypothetical protein
MASTDFTQITNITEITRIVRLSYLQTVAALDDQAQLNSLAGAGGGTPPSSFTATDPGSPGFLGIGAEGPSSQSQNFTDSGWSITRTWQETYWDKVRWGIGVREIGLFSFRYAVAGELVSVPYLSPSEISKVSLRVDELIPNIYPNTQRWIQYFVSGDDGDNWIRINPLDHPSLFTGGGGRPVPRIINFNPDFESEDSDENKFIRTNRAVSQVRFRAIFLRPGTSDLERTTPILKSYKLQIVPKGGLIDG